MEDALSTVGLTRQHVQAAGRGTAAIGPHGHWVRRRCHFHLTLNFVVEEAAVVEQILVGRGKVIIVGDGVLQRLVHTEIGVGEIFIAEHIAAGA